MRRRLGFDTHPDRRRLPRRELKPGDVAARWRSCGGGRMIRSGERRQGTLGRSARCILCELRPRTCQHQIGRQRPTSGAHMNPKTSPPQQVPRHPSAPAGKGRHYARPGRLGRRERVARRDGQARASSHPRRPSRTSSQTSDKKRFALSDDGQRICASQGHSVKVDLGYSPATPPRRALPRHGRSVPASRSGEGGLVKGAAAPRPSQPRVGDRHQGGRPARQRRYPYNRRRGHAARGLAVLRQRQWRVADGSRAGGDLLRFLGDDETPPASRGFRLRPEIESPWSYFSISVTVSFIALGPDLVALGVGVQGVGHDVLAAACRRRRGTCRPMSRYLTVLPPSSSLAMLLVDGLDAVRGRVGRASRRGGRRPAAGPWSSGSFSWSVLTIVVMPSAISLVGVARRGCWCRSSARRPWA